MSSFSKNLQRFLVIFFTATSVILIVMGVLRIKKPTILAEAPTPTPTPPPSDTDTTGTSITVKGSSYQTPWGSAVASITVKDGRVIAAAMPSIPNSPPSVYAVPFLVDQAVKAGSANIQGVSGATYTSIAFKSSLESAIAKVTTQGQTITANPQAATTIPTAKPSVPRKYIDEDEEEEEWEEWEEEWND